MTLKICAYKIDEPLQQFDSLELLGDVRDYDTVWIDIEGSDASLLTTIAHYFHLHELTVEDCLDREHSPKLEDFGNYIFMIFRGLRPVPVIDQELQHDVASTQSEDEMFTTAVSLYLSEHYLITHRNDEVPWLDALMRQTTQIPEKVIGDGADMLAHRVIDVLIDRFTRGLGAFEDLIDKMEDYAIQTPDEFELTDVLELKRELGSLRQTMRDHKVSISRLAHERTLIRDDQVRRYFRDIDDHATAAIKQIDKQIEMLIGIRDVYFAMANVRLGDIMRVLAVITTIAVPLNIVVGVYGMNFAVIPLLDNPYGFWLVMALMILLILLMLLFFRRNRWI